MEPVSCKKLIKALFKEECVKIEKTAQLADFRVRPIGKLGLYAAEDVHYLLDAFWKLYLKVPQKVQITKPSDVELFKTLHSWRDEIARVIDENPDVIMSAAEMEALAKFSKSKHLTKDTLADLLKDNHCPFTILQYRRIIAIVNNDEIALQSMSTIECRNCHGSDHQG
ncbi:unnamed protein product [Allacma fusca]|uniref:HRDC domain-containing protein n=1 Tax=Allacma fusca TaxID=39272 RepID=A0A8J2J1F7_9HEXA|nr:unnamed protein product [Allacma fusca]